MGRFASIQIVLLSALLSIAHARPKGAGLAGGELPTIENVLVKAGWTMTPERSATYTVGDIYNRITNTPVAFYSDCFSAIPREGAYTSLEVVQALKIGARVPLGVARFRAKGMQYKQLTFAEPYVQELADMHLVPNESCTRFLKRRPDLRDLIVIKAVLSAEVKEQLCRTLESSAGALGFGASVEGKQECNEASEGHVAVAYKTQPAAKLFSLPIVPATSPDQAALQHQLNLNFGSTGDLGVDEKLRIQSCTKGAEQEGAANRSRQLDKLIRTAKEKARIAWHTRVGELTRCTGLPMAQRDGCIYAVEQWLHTGRAITVTLPAGVESVETDCGNLQPAYPEERRTQTAEDVQVAETLLLRLRTAALPVRPPEPAVSEPTTTPSLVTGIPKDMRFVRIEPSEFNMGSPKSEAGRYRDEALHRVRITRSLLVSRTEITNGQWAAVMGRNPVALPTAGCSRNTKEFAIAADMPAACVTWYEVLEFANQMSQLEGIQPCYDLNGEPEWPKGVSCRGFRLPTEAEWEYIAKGGATAVFAGSATPNAVAWHRTNSDGTPHKVATKNPNPAGVYDLSGNVWEWVWESSGAYPIGGTKGYARVMRGGSFMSAERDLRAAARGRGGVREASDEVGFRLVRTVE
jgi:sulfatase modifying factor 1